jgi:hypothetical protein
LPVIDSVSINCRVSVTASMHQRITGVPRMERPSTRERRESVGA